MSFFRTSLFLLCLLAMTVVPCHAVTNIMYGGSYPYWPSVWNPILSLNDPDDGQVDRFDLVGDSSNPAVYWACDANFVYFRLRVDDGTPGSNLWGGTLMVMIDQLGYGTAGEPDWGIAWDYKENQQQNHGLELMVPYVIGISWGDAGSMTWTETMPRKLPTRFLAYRERICSHDRRG